MRRAPVSPPAGARGGRRRPSCRSQCWREFRPAPSRRCACPSACCCSTTGSSSCSAPSTARRCSTRPSRRCWRRCQRWATAEARLKIAAAEAALRLNALSPEALADLYRRHEFSRKRAVRSNRQPQRPAAASCPAVSRHELRARPRRRCACTRFARRGAALDGCPQTAAHAGAAARQHEAGPGTDWFSENGVEMALAAGNFDAARALGGQATARRSIGWR